MRYLVSETLPKPYPETARGSVYAVFENPNALSLGFTADAAASDSIGAEDSFAYLEALYAACAPEAAARIFSRAAVSEPELENFRRDGDLFTRLEFSPAKLTYTVTPTADGPLYAEFSIPDYPGIMLFAGGVMRAWTATAQTNGTVYLGEYAAGESVTVTLQASADLRVEHAAFATEDAAALARYVKALRTGACPLTKISSSRFIGTYTAGEGDALLVTTLPYDDSWRVRLDGKPVRSFELQDCLMAVETGPGTHTLELRYIPAGLLPGAAISLAALAACLAAYLRRRGKTME